MMSECDGEAMEERPHTCDGILDYICKCADGRGPVATRALCRLGDVSKRARGRWPSAKSGGSSDFADCGCPRVSVV